jgi:hypothetical protein
MSNHAKNGKGSDHHATVVRVVERNLTYFFFDFFFWS